MRAEALRSLVSAGILAACLAAPAADALAQTAPDDEPLPPAIGRPPATAPAPAPAPAPPPPAPTTPPAPAPAPAPRPRPEAWREPLAPVRAPSSNAAGTLEATAAPPPAPRQPGPVDPDSLLPSLTGPIGLYHISTAEVGPTGHLRFGLHGQFFRASNFLVEGADHTGDVNTRFAGAFTFGFTPHESIELFGAITSSSNRNVRSNKEMDRTDPELIKSFGDLVLGGKAVAPVMPGFSAGAELGFRFLSGISDLSVSPSSTSLWIGPVATVDLRQLANAPIRFHANINYYLDNSSNLYDFSNRTQPTREVAMFAYGIAASRLRFGLGVDAPLEQFTGPVGLHPFAEYHAEIVTASPDPAFADVPMDPGNRDQHWLTVGMRARVFHGFTLDAGIDIGLRPVGYQYGPPLPPYDLIFGMSYPFDTAAFARPSVVTRTVEKAPAPAMGSVVGTVKNKADGKPVAEAVVSFTGQPRARVATDPDGTFQSVPLPPGPTDITVAAAGFEPAAGKANVVAGSASTVSVELVAKIVNGNVRGKVSDRSGRGLPATIRFMGSTSFDARADSGGEFSAILPAGPYRVAVQATGFPAKDLPLDVAAGQDRQLDVTLRPANPDVTLTPQAIVLRVPIKFRAGAPKLVPAVKVELEAVADILADHPEIKTLRIEAHWSGATKGKGAAKTKTLTEKQAAAVKDFLVGKGSPADRIETVGAGGEAPLVPNLGPANQAKNRRVELVVVQ